MIFFQNPISIALVIIGASLPDFDHNIKKLNVYKMIIIGLISFIILYIANLPYFIGIIFLIIPIIFYFSNHRGFTHSILGILILSLLLSIVIIMGIFLIYPSLEYLTIMNNIENYYIISAAIISAAIIVLILGILTINKNLIVPFIVLFLLGIIFLPIEYYSFFTTFDISYNFINWLIYSINTITDINLITGFNLLLVNQMMIYFFLPLFLGFLTHLILDSLTPTGIELFRPFSSKKVHKKFAVACLILILLLAILKYFFTYNYYF
ncbi:hypothetical protein MBBAR_3c01900 [Methanobrevibacter arboriphilus JCM 13429 = DSM 1125]|uniref:Membrane-bound metal-dependent hydrolase n=2 Tax=Methanobrevibacter arboriphilus TaxID=39441 RepID=A0A1V6N4M1_METAZ|nr:hypothetical protein MBBAR_3c01900 [Methanobrevibacter arboriphilus JCM 13429 = DSM 1125]